MVVDRIKRFLNTPILRKPKEQTPVVASLGLGYVSTPRQAIELSLHELEERRQDIEQSMNARRRGLSKQEAEHASLCSSIAAMKRWLEANDGS